MIHRLQCIIFQFVDKHNKVSLNIFFYKSDPPLSLDNTICDIEYSTYLYYYTFEHIKEFIW